MVKLRLSVRRFRCRQLSCQRKTFSETLAPSLGRRHGRRVARCDGLLHAVALVLGGRPGSRMMARLAAPWSRDTLLRAVRRGAAAAGLAPAATVIGIDDFAWRRGHSYGSIVVDLERRKVIDILPDRQRGTIVAWLKENRQVRVICRDRGPGYGAAAAEAAPQARQVADRWHLFENASAPPSTPALFFIFPSPQDRGVELARSRTGMPPPTASSAPSRRVVRLTGGDFSKPPDRNQASGSVDPPSYSGLGIDQMLPKTCAFRCLSMPFQGVLGCRDHARSGAVFPLSFCGLCC